MYYLEEIIKMTFKKVVLMLIKKKENRFLIDVSIVMELIKYLQIRNYYHVNQIKKKKMMMGVEIMIYVFEIIIKVIMHLNIISIMYVLIIIIILMEIMRIQKKQIITIKIEYEITIKNVMKINLEIIVIQIKEKEYQQIQLILIEIKIEYPGIVNANDDKGGGYYNDVGIGSSGARGLGLNEYVIGFQQECNQGNGNGRCTDNPDLQDYQFSDKIFQLIFGGDQPGDCDVQFGGDYQPILQFSITVDTGRD
ncbi:MAG: hypothetical protein EZS28_002646 [Streblomastix strix]|uniref:Uncharacterized protein n=1 Tax=Streblomastix strix TaxID=222440 RepID=A0A5J4X3M0_9EUKA|nr:MAG: hypothetical protein EZS28_002646 [Streblomastix strix]